MKLTEAQADILSRMQYEPDEIYTAEKLSASISTLQALGRKGLVSGVVGLTRTVGSRRGMLWKLTTEGRKAQP